MTLQKSTTLLEKFSPSPSDSWVWNYAEIQDIDSIVQLSSANYTADGQTHFTINEAIGRFNLDMSITRQRHNLASEQLLVCRDKTTAKLIAWSWIQRGKTFPFSTDEMAEATIVHLDLSQSTRTRIHLLAQILHYWETWARACNIPVILTSSIRIDNDGFTNLHRRAGYDVRGGTAIKRLVS